MTGRTSAGHSPGAGKGQESTQCTSTSGVGVGQRATWRRQQAVPSSHVQPAGQGKGIWCGEVSHARVRVLGRGLSATRGSCSIVVEPAECEHGNINTVVELAEGC